MSQQKEQMPPVLIVDLVKRYGGAEVRVLDMARSLHFRRQPYAVATLSGSPLHRRLEAAGLQALPIPYKRSDPRLALFLKQAICSGGYRILDAHNVQSQFWAQLAGWLAGVSSRVSTIHSNYRQEYGGSLKGRLYEQVLRLNARWNVRFVAVSEAVSGYLQEIGIPPDRISLIHNSIQLPEQAPVGKDIALLDSFGWSEDVYIVSVVARLEPVKGHTFLIEALRQVASARPRLRCLVVGDGRTREVLESQVRESGLGNTVHFAGFREDIPALLRTSDAFCLPSLSEGLPYALLEACAQRLPVLVTGVGGMAKLLNHKQTGYLVPSADPAALAAGLCWLIDHPDDAAVLGQAAFRLLQQKFSPVEMIDRTLAVYRQE